MKRLFLLTVVVITVLGALKTAKAQCVTIDGVYIEPNQPMNTDSITVVVYGEACRGPVTVIGTGFYRDGTFLQLWILLELGPFWWITPWDHSVVIGKLPADSYNLVVGASSPPYLTSFIVVPNPADFEPDGDVDLSDFAILALAWRSSPGDYNWDPACDISEPNDSVINELDLAVFAKHWLEGVNLEPVVYITEPEDGDVIDSKIDSVWITADAWDVDGSVVKVKFIIDCITEGWRYKEIDNDGSDGWKACTNFYPGTYILTAKATDDDGATTTSPPVTITAVE